MLKKYSNYYKYAVFTGLIIPYSLLLILLPIFSIISLIIKGSFSDVPAYYFMIGLGSWMIKPLIIAIIVLITTILVIKHESKQSKDKKISLVFSNVLALIPICFILTGTLWLISVISLAISLSGF